MEIIERRQFRHKPTLYKVDLGDGPVWLTKDQLDDATPPEYEAFEPPEEE